MTSALAPANAWSVTSGRSRARVQTAAAQLRFDLSMLIQNPRAWQHVVDNCSRPVQGNGQRQAQAAPEAAAGDADVASDDDYSDQQPRIISLAPHGSRWQERTDQLMRCLEGDEEMTWCLV